jgi:hypothetical protein
MKIFKTGIEISDTDVKALLNDIYDPDSNDPEKAIEKWVRKAIDGKVANCRGRLTDHWVPRLLEDSAVRSIPGSTDALIDLITRREDYSNRADRELLIVRDALETT